MHKVWHPGISHTMSILVMTVNVHIAETGQNECQWQLKLHVFAQETGVLKVKKWKTSWNSVLHGNILFLLKLCINTNILKVHQENKT